MMHTEFPALKSKFPNMGRTIFTVMSEMAGRYDAINLSQGFPDFDGPAALHERVTWHLANGHNQYAPLAGVPGLLKQIARKVDRLYDYPADPERNICVTPGATEAIHCAISCCVHAGDEVIVFDPAYDTYAPCVTLNGGVTRHVPLTYPDFSIDWRRVGQEITDRTRLIILNNPHNPTGSVWSETDIEALRALVDGTRILLLSDEVYEHITFDGREHLSLLRFPDLAARAFCVFSFGKTYHVTGWRTGYCIAPGELMQEFLRVHQNISFSSNAPMQYALADFLREHPDHPHELGDFYANKRNLFNELMNNSRFIIKPSAGTFFQLADYSGISDETDVAFAERLTREHGVAVIPVSVFYREPPEQRVIRFCFAKNDETLRKAARRLQAV